VHICQLEIGCYNNVGIIIGLLWMGFARGDDDPMLRGGQNAQHGTQGVPHAN